MSALHSSFRAVEHSRVRGLIVLAMLGVVAWLGLGIGRPWAVAVAVEPAATNQQAAAEPVGARR